MFDALPSRIENRIDPGYKKRKRKFHPMMLEEALHMNRDSSNPILGFLIMISWLKDDYPWLYEIGLETYRGLRSFTVVGNGAGRKKKLINSFENALEMATHPMMREFQDKQEDTYYMLKEMRHILPHYLERIVNVKNDGNQPEL